MADVAYLAAALDALEQRVAALQEDRDYWRRQHDLVMRDWKDDLAQLGSRTEANMSESKHDRPPKKDEPASSEPAEMAEGERRVSEDSMAEEPDLPV